MDFLEGLLAMVVGICTMELWFPEPNSLKEKRRILKSIIDRVRSRFNVSIAEVDHNDLWQKASIGIACVANEGSHVNEVLSNVVNFVETSFDVNLIDYSIQVI